MQKLVWATDIHLNFIDADEVAEFGGRLAATRPDAVLIGGDIGEAHSVEDLLLRLQELVPAPIYFVLGNHDYYGSSISRVRARMVELSQKSPRLRWLPTAGVIKLSSRTALVGHDGWADAQLGDWTGSRVMLNDYVWIEELAHIDREERKRRLIRLGEEAAAALRNPLRAALDGFEHVVVLTHVPPYREACWHEGKVSSDEFLPHFACRATGEVLSEFAAAYPERRLTVLCGHTHSSGTTRPLPNLEVRTGAATYGMPEMQPLLTVE